MANEGSSLSNLNVNHVTERVQNIREGQVKLFVQDASGEWVAARAASEQLLPFATPTIGGVAISTGAATQVAEDVPADVVMLQASNLNTGLIYIGEESLARGTAFELPPGATITLAISNLNQIYALADETGDKLKYIIGVR